MPEYEISVERTGAKVATRAQLADGPLTRMKGLLGRRSLDRGEALILRPCWSVHTWFMRFALDVVFVDKTGRVLKIARRIGPWRFTAARGAADAIEFQGGSLDSEDLAEGDRLLIAPATTTPDRA
ncbi:MAG TPA: DUF192 domain-containing protein [Dehalococcoidia bacterium]|nr:DUF192 domain-containing protein [Dehalococcoidia bacterium]